MKVAFVTPQGERIVAEAAPGDDLRLVRSIYEELYPKNPEFTLTDVIALLGARPDLRSINEHVQQKAVR